MSIPKSQMHYMQLLELNLIGSVLKSFMCSLEYSRNHSNKVAFRFFPPSTLAKDEPLEEAIF